ncbi:hypothetical protein L915_13127 [Phytophthora nicotianae]|uniref:EGF-like domain-containing protein n=1 Tax=Phytophthora nicotianae TaxID=4792 RepID=W2IL32_PHYNI|nr:hypothetical protein L915_13127 [Phytophthora nicotianae]ETL34795.1 hypothetical protein L916_13018 [Phytophthora nicotianae]
MTFVMRCCLVMLLVMPVLALSPGDIGDVTTPPSGCQLCASTGDCSQAFRNGPGQFCGTWMDRSSHELPCCCPLNAVCNVSPADYVCTCAYVGAMPPYHSDSDFMNKVLWLWWIIGVVAVVAVCGACCYFLVKRMVDQSDGSYSYVSPEVVAPLVSPTREALYRSTGQIFAKESESAAGAGERTAIGAAPGIWGGVPQTTHLDLDVGGDGFDGGLGSVEKDQEADEAKQGESDAEDGEEIALLTVQSNE